MSKIHPLIVAHRGASFDAPENTLAAFRLAFAQHADAIEADVWLSADGQVVCCHDETLARTGGDPRRIADLTAEELSRVDVGSWRGAAFAGERPPLLADVLAVVPAGKLLFVEVKAGPELLPALQRELRRTGFSIAQLRIISFHAGVIAASKRLFPGVTAYWLAEFSGSHANVAPEVEAVLSALAACRADGLDCQADLGTLADEFVGSIRDAGYPLHAWTVDDIATARELIALGFESITTNRPGFLRSALRLSAPDA